MYRDILRPSTVDAGISPGHRRKAGVLRMHLPVKMVPDLRYSVTDYPEEHHTT